MRARTHSFASLPATSVLATAVLTVAWWVTMIGLSEPTAPQLGLVLITASVSVAVVSVAAHPQVGAAFTRWVLRRVRPSRGSLAPEVGQRWHHAARSVSGPRPHDIELLRVSRPRAPGWTALTA